MFAFVGETLRRLRKERGKTLEQLGEEAGLGRGQLSRIENSRQEATLTTLGKVLGSQNVGRREFFRRYDLVESEAEALGRAGADGRQEVDRGPAASSGDWPEEIRDVLGKLESFVNMTFRQPRPVAQGAIEVGDLVILFRIVPKSAPEVHAAEGAAPAVPPGDLTGAQAGAQEGNRETPSPRPSPRSRPARPTGKTPGRKKKR